jgi:predicted Zn-dependent peptidase
MLWPGQPLGRPITGTKKSLAALKRGQLIGYLRSHYVTGATVLVAAGNLKHRRLLHAVRRYAPRFRRGPRPKFTPAQSAQREPRVALVTKNTEQAQLALGIRACSRHDDRRYALRLLNTILGENMSSRLFQIVREDRGLAYSIYSTTSHFDDTGDLVISAGLDTDKLPQTLRLILRELRRCAETPPDAAELRRAHDFVIGQIELGLESTDNQMNWIGEYVLGHGKIIPPAEMKRRLRAVTAGEIRSVAQDLFRPERLNLALVSPLKNRASLARLLKL